ncbi:MAG: hypothetical protein KDN19_18655 [Verrucomicrobiae bacterium]|nr:hypothetical protein [Verrucomicrobiae bacterium]
MKISTFDPIDPEVAEKLDDLQALIRGDQLFQARRILSRIIPMSDGDAIKRIELEARFLRTVDASHAFGTSYSPVGLTPRQAVIYGALVGWRDGDEPSPWMSPMIRPTLVDIAESHYQGPRYHLGVAFDAMVLEGLFVEVWPGFFEEPCFQCTFDPEFLAEIPDGEDHFEYWSALKEHYDNATGSEWQEYGVCVGGDWDYPKSICLSKDCECYREGRLTCRWGLPFAHPLLKSRV